MTGRSYSDPGYGAHKTVSFDANIILHSAASAANAAAYTFLTPSRVLGGHITLGSEIAGDLTVTTNWLLGKSTDLGTNLAQFATNLAIYSELATATHSAGEVFAFSAVTETNFDAGDSVWLQIEGTSGALLSNITVNLEVKEVFVQSDS